MDLIIAITLGLLCLLMWLVLDSMKQLEAEISFRLHRIEHNQQQIKVRQTWSKRREKQDLKTESTNGGKVKYKIQK